MMDHQHHNHSAVSSVQELRLNVEGMHCAACAGAVQRAIQSTSGVKSAAVNVTNGQAVVSGDGLDVQSIVNAIERSGYHAKPIEDLPTPAELKSEIELRQAKHEREWGRRAIIGLGIWAPLEALHWISRFAVGGTGGPQGHVHGVGWMDWIMFIGATAVLTTAGGGFYRSAWNAARRRTTNMDTLIAMGATTAYVYSLVVFAMKSFGSPLEQSLYFSESAALLGIISLGHYLEARATARAGSAVRELLELQPDQAEIMEASGRPSIAIDERHQPRIIPSAQVQPGDHILIRPGGRASVDGIVIDGESDVDESVVTGESMPIHKSKGDSVSTGSLNTTGVLIIQATVDGRHTTIARIAEIVQRAQSSKADIQRLADYIASIFVPVVLVIAALTLIGWWFAGDFSTGVISTVTVLIISCPCALGLATPMAVMVGSGAASKRGILVKSASALEIAGRATHVIFDKTGTLTSGSAEVISIEPTGKGELADRELLRAAASAEAASEHPIARAVVRAARQRGIEIGQPKEFQAIAGEGVRARVNGHLVEVMRDDLATARVEVDGKLAGRLNVADAVRPDARAAVERLRQMDLKVLMLSGDRRGVAEGIGAQLGLIADAVIAEATPETKMKVVQELGSRVIMVGDGINDAAALAQADVGIAMASGTNIAIESADIVIPGDRVMAVPETVEIARQTLRTIKQNLFFAFIYNVVAIPAAALGLLGAIGPLIAAAAMGLSDVTVIGNAIRLKRKLDRSR